MQLFHEGLKDLLNINDYLKENDFGFLIYAHILTDAL